MDDNPGSPFIDGIVPADCGEPDTDPSYLGRRVPDICDRELNTIFTVFVYSLVVVARKVPDQLWLMLGKI